MTYVRSRTSQFSGAALALLLAIGIVSGGCSDSSGPTKQCPVCGQGLVCNSATGQCIAASADSGGGSCTNGCGSNAVCQNTTCACNPGWLDCNGELGQVGSDGCECSGQCNGQQCSTPTPDQGAPKDAAVEGGQKCSSSDVTKGCGDVNQWCDFGTCASCAPNKFNCNGVDACECDTGCDGTKCQGATACDYSDPDACGKDTSQWCYSNKCQACSSGYFNCNNTKGCECDSAGCNGTACAGKCLGGEC